MRATVRTLLLLFAIVLSACSAIGESPSLQFATVNGAAAYETGRSHFIAGRYGLAIKHLRQAVNADNQSIDALNALAAAYDNVGRFDLALHNYERALTIDSASAQTLNNIGYSYYLQGRYDVAAVYLQDAAWVSDELPKIRGNVDLVEQALNDKVIPMPTGADTRQLGAVETPPTGSEVGWQIVRVSRQEQVLTKVAVKSRPSPVQWSAAFTGHPLLAALSHPSPMTIGRPVPSSLTIALPPISSLTVLRPRSSLTISPPPVLQPVDPTFVTAGFISDYVVAAAAEPAAVQVAKAFWIAGQPVPIHGAGASYSPNSSYW